MQKGDQNSNRDEGKIYRWSTRVSCFVIGYAGLVAAVLSAAVLIAGIVEIVQGLWEFFDALVKPKPSPTANMINIAGALPPEKSALIKVIHGIEFFLLAPLPYLILNCVAKYVSDWEFRGEVSATTRGKILEAKLLLIGLFFGILMADFITKVFGNSITADKGWIHLCALGLLAFFFFGLELVLMTRGKKSATNPSE